MASFRPSRRKRRSAEELDAVFDEAKSEARQRAQGYRQRSLAMHGWICAKCAKEFESADLHRLTVHHKDGNHDNNPPNGSNWENLCDFCHEAEHQRDLLAAYRRGD